MAALMGLLLLIGFFFAYIFIVGYFRAFVLTKLWGYFIVPLGLEQIELWHAWGLSVIIGLFTYQYNDNDMKNKDLGEKVAVFINPIMLSLIAWGIGAFIHGQMVG